MEAQLNRVSSILRSRKTQSTLLSTALVALLAAPVMAEEASESEADKTEVITVRGILGSMKAAALLKRTDGRIIDAIVAEDIGKLPDNNIAEALQRISGVSINTDFGVGSSVSIRGLSQNRVELNGRSTVGDSRDGVSMEDFPSSFLKSVSVVKSPTADMIEGALGGTVSMETVSPLEFEELKGAVSLDFEYADKTENWAPIFNASVGNSWELGDAGSFGAMFLVSYQDRKIRQDEYSNRLRVVQEAAGPTDPVTGAYLGGGAGDIGEGNTASGGYVFRDQNRVEQYVEDRERTAYNLQLEWAPASGNGNIYLDLAFTERDGQQAGNSILEVGGSRDYTAATTQDANGQLNNTILRGAFVIPKTWSDFRQTDTFTHALGGEWNLSDNVKISGEISVASSESYNPDSEFNLRPVNKTNWNIWADQYDPATSGTYDDDCRINFDCRHTSDVTLSQNGEDVPSIIYADQNVYTNPENLAVRAFWFEGKTTKNDETAARFDIEFIEPMGLEWLSSLEAGVRVTKRDFELNEETFRFNDIYSNAFTDQGTASEKPATFWADDFEAAFPGSFEVVSHPNSFDQSGLSGQNDLLTYLTYRGNLLANPEATFDKVNQLLAGTNLALTGGLHDNTQRIDNSFSDIEEETAAIYVSSHLDFDELTGIIGARYVTTDIDSGYIADGKFAVDSNDYSDFLPSINLNYSLDDNTQLRFAAAKVMRRADFGDLSPSISADGFAVTATSGSATLKPHRATQYDLSVEHYYGEANIVSFAIFYKDVKSFLSQTATCVASEGTTEQNVTEWQNVCILDQAGVTNDNLVLRTTSDFAGAADPEEAGFIAVGNLRDQGLTGINTARTTNGENGSIRGFEASIQHGLDFLPGLGVSANWTYADSEQPNGSTLLDVSKNTFNGQIYWENDEFQVRLAYNYRSRYLATEDERLIETIGALALDSSTDEADNPLFDPTSGNNYREDRGQFDFSASWDVNENLTLVTNVTNLTGEPSLFSTELGSVWKWTEADRRFTVGVRAKF
ncbi:TonB-dependent receptor [Pseudocolwellia sp. HL-MZ19]|uniref:TonB-dependent receptor n=1 Tax=unclassified Pseudocolwellia TaxID=2848178 RepID=UPI003CFB7E9E